MHLPRSDDFFPLKATLHLKYNSALSMNAASAFSYLFSSAFLSGKEQNYISNAKMMLMQRNHLSEDDAYRYIQKSSMDSGTNMVETAQMLLMLLYES